MRQFDFTFYAYELVTRTLTPREKGEVIVNNSLFVRSLSHAEERLARADPFLVLDEVI